MGFDYSRGPTGRDAWISAEVSALYLTASQGVGSKAL